MKKIFIILIIFPFFVEAQNKSGNVWILGAYMGVTATFNDTARPFIYPRYINPPLYFIGHSNICDSATGKLLFSCNGMVMYDSNCNVMENGDTLVPLNIYTNNAFPVSGITQGSLILPKGNSGEYYVFIPTVSDTTYNKWFLPNAVITPYDMLIYNVVDLNANGGLGKVEKKALPLLTNTEMSRTMMQACRHSNGVDWWLLKKLSIEQNIIARFLVTKDSVYGPYLQVFAEPNFSVIDHLGQIAFNKNGTMLTQVQGKSNKLFIADFDRCTGELSNPKVFNIPIDSTTIPNASPQYLMDSLTYGVCFSPNGKYIYITKRWNIYQFEYEEPDSNLAWSHIKQGPDTTYQYFEYYGALSRGIDDRIYIGKGGGGLKQISVIDKPDNKGLACSFCRKCFRLDDTTNAGFISPPNMPDFNLGPSGQVCWPLALSPLVEKQKINLEVFPNPASNNVTISYQSKEDGIFILFNSLGDLILETTLSKESSRTQLQLADIANGIYHYEIEFAGMKKTIGKLSIQK